MASAKSSEVSDWSHRETKNPPLSCGGLRFMVRSLLAVRQFQAQIRFGHGGVQKRAARIRFELGVGVLGVTRLGDYCCGRRLEFAAAAVAQCIEGAAFACRGNRDQAWGGDVGGLQVVQLL